MALKDRIMDLFRRSNIFADPFSHSEEVMRYEVFTVDRLELHAEDMASTHEVTSGPGRRYGLEQRLRENWRFMSASYRVVLAAMHKEAGISLAAECLLSSFHVIEPQVKRLCHHFPTRSYFKLPMISAGTFKGFPRIYAVAASYVAHTDSRYEPSSFTRMFGAYQRGQSLTSAERPLVDLILQAVLIENLRRVAILLVRGHRWRAEADRMADELSDSVNCSAKTLRGLMETSKAPPVLPFITRLAQRLRSQEGGHTEAMHWLEGFLELHGISLNAAISMELKQQTLAHVTIHNIVTSLKDLSKAPARVESAPGEAWEAGQGSQVTIAPYATGVPKTFPPAGYGKDTALYPASHFLSNGSYAVMINSSGFGYSRWRSHAITRWHMGSLETSGSFFFLRDLKNGEAWSMAQAPPMDAISHATAFTEERACLTYDSGDVSMMQEIILSPEDDVELRRLSIYNKSASRRTMEVTSFSRIELVSHEQDQSDPEKLIPLKVEYRRKAQGLLTGRRPQSPQEMPVWAAHVVAMHGINSDDIEYETDGRRVMDRWRGSNPSRVIMENRFNDRNDTPDPIFSLRIRVQVEPGATSLVTFSTMAAPSRNEILLLMEKYRNACIFDFIHAHARTYSRISLKYLGISTAEAWLFQSLADTILFSDRQKDMPCKGLLLCEENAPILWGQGVVGDYPLLLVRINENDHSFLRQMIRAQEYWQFKELEFSLVILIERECSSVLALQLDMKKITAFSRVMRNQAGNRIAMVRADMMTTGELELLQNMARVQLLANEGSLKDQIARIRGNKTVSAVSPVDDTSAIPSPIADTSSSEAPMWHDTHQIVAL